MIFILPLSVLIPRKTKEARKVILNMNTYRNLHHMTNNQAKILFKEQVMVQDGANLLPAWAAINWIKMPPLPLKFTYTLFQEANRKTDVANVLSIVDKFTCDALVELDIIPDDNCRILPCVVYRYGGVDKINPRAELEITTYG